MPSEAKQAKILFHAFLGRIFDFELLSTGGESQNLLIQFAALLGAFNFVLAFILVPRYGLSTQSQAVLAVNAWHDEEFLIATTIATTALLMVLSWESLIPDRRDCIGLGILPIRSQTILLAKVGAIGCAVVAAVAVVNAFTSFCYPLVLLPTGKGILTMLRAFLAYWITMLAAGLFTACAVLSIQGILNQILPYRLFLRVSALLQMACFFLVLTVYFLKPPLATPESLLAAHHSRWLSSVPSYWFFALFHQLNGSAPGHAFDWLTLRSLLGLLIVIGGATLVYALGYARMMRRIIEQPDIVPADRSRRSARVVRWFQRKLLTDSLKRAVILFITRTLARSRQHRLLIAFYSGIGLAIALAYYNSWLEENVRGTWQASMAFVTPSLLLLFFVVLAVRVSFSFPHTLLANWIFRTTTVHRPAEYLDAVRSSLYLIAWLPLWILYAFLFFAIWPNRQALGHLAILAMIGTILVERSLNGFRKIPFACSYLPGKANLKVTLALYGSLILFLANALGAIESWALHHLISYFVVSSVLTIAAILAHRRRSEFVNAPHNSLQFDDVAPGTLFSLDLSADRDLTNDDEYIAAQHRPLLRSRLKTGALILVLFMFSGGIYERLGEWRDHRLFPQMGRSVDVGGRSMNIYCSGEGSPTVIFEGNWGSPGYSWLLIQRDVAKFTRACWYDRAGYGWSDEGPFPNHSDSIARSLHRLLTGAGVQPPYLFVAHAMGTFHARVYRGFYPSEVAGLVLVDPMNEDMTIHIHNHIEALRPAVLFLHRMMGVFGWFRLLRPDVGTPARGWTSQEWTELHSLRWRPRSLVAQGKEPPIWINGELARQSGAFGDIPVVVLSAGIQDREEDAKLDQDHAWKMELHHRLANLSTKGTQVIEQSGHDIPMETPDAVVCAVIDVVSQIRPYAAATCTCAAANDCPLSPVREF